MKYAFIRVQYTGTDQFKFEIVEIPDDTTTMWERYETGELSKRIVSLKFIQNHIKDIINIERFGKSIITKSEFHIADESIFAIGTIILHEIIDKDTDKVLGYGVYERMSKKGVPHRLSVYTLEKLFMNCLVQSLLNETIIEEKFRLRLSGQRNYPKLYVDKNTFNKYGLGIGPYDNFTYKNHFFGYMNSQYSTGTGWAVSITRPIKRTMIIPHEIFGIPVVGLSNAMKRCRYTVITKRCYTELTSYIDILQDEIDFDVITTLEQDIDSKIQKLELLGQNKPVLMVVE